ncbi:hypothetical protein AB0J74_18155 [Asanoa sp. NPDC049573]|uniref:hypothetical protein n=1 Tax=Asanoa sp. NPDC049573 TaxID=3155396 RepID=UPI0034173E5F
MTLESEVRAAMAAAVEHVRPAPDPLARLLSRKTRTRRWGWTAAGVVAALGAVIAAGGVTSTADRVEPPPPVSRADWIRQLLESPPRGSLTTDEAFMAKLRAATGRAPRILLADEVADQRIAVVSTAEELRLFAGPRDGTIDDLLAGWAAVGGPFEHPFVHGAINGLQVGIAPDGCEIDTAALPEATDWRPARTDSYLVRVARQPGEWWRVTCGGEVRFEGPARGGEQFRSDPETVAQAQRREVALASGDSRGSVDQDLGKQADRSLDETMGDRLTAPPRAVFGGPATVALAAPAVGGGWWVCLGRDLEGGVSTNLFHTMSDPFAGTPVTAARDVDGTVAVIGPANATAARIRLAGRTIMDGSLSEGFGLLKVDPAVLSEADGRRAQVEALDDAGTVLATGPVDDGPPPRDVVDRWGD